MAYLDQANRHSPGSMIAALGVQGTIIAALVLGLSVGGIVTKVDTRTAATNFKLPPPPPPPEPAAEPRQAPKQQPRVFAPTPPIQLDVDPIDFGTAPDFELDLPDLGPIGGGAGTGAGDGTGSEPVLSFDPVTAKPRNDPAQWVTTRDYRSTWIRREMVGTARFRLEIAANGAVTGCRVTGSTGHAQLDDATCSLVSRRARFQPARDSRGEAVAGSYASAVSWELPE